jgi:hypothetical protein
VKYPEGIIKILYFYFKLICGELDNIFIFSPNAMPRRSSKVLVIGLRSLTSLPASVILRPSGDRSLLHMRHGNRFKPFSRVRNPPEHLFSLFWPSVRMKQLENCRTDFHEMWYSRVLRKIAASYKFLLRVDSFNVLP